MTGLRIGSLFTGYGGLTLAVEQVFGGTTAWVSDIEQRDKKGALVGNAPLILEHRFPSAPNLGDITAVDWSQVEPVDIIDGGSPCQDVSAAGARAGMAEGTRSNLWVAMREAVAQLKPALVIWENVAGALSAKAQSKEDRERDSRVESEPGLLGGGPGGPALRAAGRVCGDLASLGFNAEWAVVRASDVGAPHQRARIFIVAAHPERIDRIWGRIGPGSAEAEGACASTARCDRASVRLLPTPAASQYGSNRSLSPGAAVRPSLAAIDKLLPTPRATRGGAATETVNLLPTPTTQPETGNGHARNLGSESRRFGDYAQAISRWEQINGPAPDPTEMRGTPTIKGGISHVELRGGRLSARFVEWLMGLPAGWVVDVPGLTRNQQLHALGNGVVPQQAAFAIRMLLTRLALQEAS